MFSGNPPPLMFLINTHCPWVIVSITWHCEDSVSSTLPAYLTKQDDWKAWILFVYCQFLGGKEPMALLASATPRAHHHVYFKIMLLWYQCFKYYNYPFIGQNKVVITYSMLCASPFLCSVTKVTLPSTPFCRKEAWPQEQGDCARQGPQKSWLGTRKPKATLGKRLAVLAKGEWFYCNCQLIRIVQELGQGGPCFRRR